MDREGVLKAVDEAHADGIKKMYDIFVQGLIGDTPADVLGQRFLKGLAFYEDAHGKTTAIIENYFKSYRV